MPESDRDGKSSDREDSKSRREFISKGTRLLYVAPLVISYDISEVYNEGEGHAAQLRTPPPYTHHGEK
jgi:hypothetical protein